MSRRLLRGFARSPDCSAQESIGFGSVTSWLFASRGGSASRNPTGHTWQTITAHNVNAMVKIGKEPQNPGLSSVAASFEKANT
jgi:hypothetical protein